ncbi:MAG: fimbrial biogenesis outer membrane usher protein, partial [Proteobacteria bacterium]|nr:fimbrial biogenesis outer membrane usher protein [Pseudomonadota bacterium]
PGNFFDSIQFRGVQVSSDDAMLPDSLQGYAPTIRGVAQTNARVTIRQNGYIIYNTYVAPGPFVIDDLYPTASSGDLEVTITEADGRITRYTQAFSAVPTLLRQGAWRYQATVGKYRNGYHYSNAYSTDNQVLGKTEPFFVQGTLARGVGNEFTVYGGFTGANIYQSVLGGVGKNLKEFGAVSADLTIASTDVDKNDALDKSFTGQSLRFLYAKSFVDSGTNFRVAGYRYSSSGFRTFPEAIEMQDQGSDSPYHNRRNEVRFDISQRIGEWGAIFASGRQQSYWGSDRKERLFQVGYSGAYKQVSYNIFYNYSTTLFGESNRQVSLSLSIPLGDTRSYAQYTASHDNRGNVNQQASVYGSALDDSRLTYNVTAGHANNDGGSYGSASASYLSQAGRVDAGYSNGRNYGQTTLGLAGGVVLHSGGVTLAQPLGESIALVEAPKADGVGFESQPGVSTNSAGYAVIPNLTPYRTNRLAMRTADLGDTVDVKNAATEVVPTRGAVVLAKFDTTVGYRLMMTLTDSKGQPLPFGARIEDGWGREAGVVGPDGQSFVTGAEESGQYNVVWGTRPEDRCAVSYALPKVETPSPIREVAAQCAAPDSSAAVKEK